MNIQIFGTKKCNDTKKAQRYFKERGIKFQFIDMNEKELSKGEFRSVCQSVGGIQAMINEECKDKDALSLVKYIADDEKEEKTVCGKNSDYRRPDFIHGIFVFPDHYNSYYIPNAQ